MTSPLAHQKNGERIVMEMTYYTEYQVWCRGLEETVLATYANSFRVCRGLPLLSMVCPVV